MFIHYLAALCSAATVEEVSAPGSDGPAPGPIDTRGAEPWIPLPAPMPKTKIPQITRAATRLVTAGACSGASLETPAEVELSWSLVDVTPTNTALYEVYVWENWVLQGTYALTTTTFTREVPGVVVASTAPTAQRYEWLYRLQIIETATGRVVSDAAAAHQEFIGECGV